MTGKKIPPSQTLTLMGHFQPVVLVSSEGEGHKQLLWVFIISFLSISLCLTIKASLVGRARGVLRSLFIIKKMAV